MSTPIVEDYPAIARELRRIELEKQVRVMRPDEVVIMIGGIAVTGSCEGDIVLRVQPQEPAVPIHKGPIYLR